MRQKKKRKTKRCWDRAECCFIKRIYIDIVQQAPKTEYIIFFNWNKHTTDTETVTHIQIHTHTQTKQLPKAKSKHTFKTCAKFATPAKNFNTY